jgi:hypothetical protein
MGNKSPVNTISMRIGWGSMVKPGAAQGEPRPLLTSVMPASVPFSPTRKSLFNASIMPPAISDPVIAAMIGLRHLRMDV